MPEVKTGDSVLYVPHLAHALDVGFDERGQIQQLFHWHHVKAHQGMVEVRTNVAGEVKRERVSVSEGDLVDWSKVGEINPKNAGHRDPPGQEWDAGAHLLTQAGAMRMRPGKPKLFWKATVTAVNPDGSCDLSIKHPNGFVTLIVPDRAAHQETAKAIRDARDRHKLEADRLTAQAADAQGATARDSLLQLAAAAMTKAGWCETEAVKADKRAAHPGVPYDAAKVQHHSYHLLSD